MISVKSPIDMGKSPNARNPSRRRKAPYIVKDLKLWKVSVVLHFSLIPEYKAQISRGAKSRRAYLLYHGKSLVSLFSFFLL